MENNNIDLLGMEKVDRSEKSILDENNELKKQLISLQRNLEEKDKRISILEMQLQKQIKNFSNNHVFTQVRNNKYRMSQKWDIVTNFWDIVTNFYLPFMKKYNILLTILL